jgi:ribA/ribD-fused uncharacterized protein
LEHFIMYQKAMNMGDIYTATLIMKAPTPAEAKALGRTVKPYDDAQWSAVRYDIMVEGIRIKMEAFPVLAEQLKATKGRFIGEASPYDAIWGIGVAVDHATANDPAQWKGENLLGRAWMRVREELLM